MRRVLPQTFFWQLIVGTVLVQTLLLCIFLVYTFFSQNEIASQRTRQRTILQLDRLSAACAKNWSPTNRETLHDLLELSRVAPTIEVARLTDLAGKTIAVTDSGKGQDLDPSEIRLLHEAVRQQVFESQSGQLEAVSPVLKHGKPVALLWLEPNYALSRTTLKAVVQVSLAYAAFALLANILPLFLIARAMTKPLRRLQEATHRVIRDPEHNQGFPLPVTTSNEAGDLTISFNTMVEELKVQRSGLLDTLTLLNSMLGNAPIGFAFFDRELRFIRLNRCLAEMFGVPVNDLLGRTIASLDVVEMIPIVEANLLQVFETGNATRDVEISGLLSHSGEVRQSWLLHFYPVCPDQGTVRSAGVIVVDITHRLLAEEALRKSEKLAATGRLAASIAHEINNPLEAVTNLLYLLQTHQPMDIEASQLVTAAQAELARVSEITQQTLRFHRHSTRPSSCKLAAVLTSVAQLYQSRTQSLQIRVVERYRGEPEVFGHAGELRQVFTNLIGNAVDAMPNGGTLILSARRSCGRGLDGALSHGTRVSVIDTGSGMSEQTLRKIFDAFFTTKQATGTGLGLWVSDEIIRKHGGTIRVRSRTGLKGGTSFMLFFPDRPSTSTPALVE